MNAPKLRLMVSGTLSWEVTLDELPETDHAEARALVTFLGGPK